MAHSAFVQSSFGNSCILLSSPNDLSVSKKDNYLRRTNFAGQFLKLQTRVRAPSERLEHNGNHKQCRRSHVQMQSVSAPPFAGQTLLKFPQQIDQWITDNPDQKDAIKLFKEKIAGRPTAVWVGDFTPDVYKLTKEVADLAKERNELYLVVMYNIPGRDAGNYSAGGAPSPDAYRKWIDDAARGLQGAKGIVILEPDALPLLDALQEDWRRNERKSLIQYAIATLKRGGATIYTDIGNPRWLSVETAAQRLQDSGVGGAAGFALNTSNSITTEECVEYGTKIAKRLGGNLGFVIDTSRNGAGYETFLFIALDRITLCALNTDTFAVSFAGHRPGSLEKTCGVTLLRTDSACRPIPIHPLMGQMSMPYSG